MALAGNWFLLALVSMVLQGFHAFLYKKLIQDGGDPRIVQVVMPAVVSVLAAIAAVAEGVSLPRALTILVIVAGVQGVLFYLTTAMRLEAIRSGAPAHIVFPLVKSSVVFIIILSAFLFDEWEALRTPRRLTSIAMILVAISMLMEWRRGPFNRGVLYALLAMVSGAGASLMAKYLFVSEAEISIFAFMLISNATTFLLAMSAAARPATRLTRERYDRSVIWGAATGLLSFGGFAAFLQAIKLGDLSIVASINALAILFPVLLSAILYGERLTFRKEIAVFLSIVALVLIQ